MGTTTAPTMASTRSPTVDKIPPTCHHNGGPYQQHIIFQTISNAMARRLWVWHWGIHQNGLEGRWRIPSEWHGKLILNLLEFLASALTIYITTIQLGQGSQILELTESSSALGWMHKASFEPVNEKSHDAVARWIVWTIVSNKKSLYSQQIKGTENIIAESLSQDFHRSEVYHVSFNC